MNSIFKRIFWRSEFGDPSIAELLDKQSDLKNIVGTMLEIRELAAARLSAAVREEDQPVHKYFGETAFVKLMTEQLLSHAIEDEGIDLRDVGPKMIIALKTYFKSGKIEDLWGIYETVVSKQPIPTHQVKLLLDSKTPIKASIAREPTELIPVSTSEFPLVPVIEETISDPMLCSDLANKYHSLIEEFSREIDIDKLCFVEKAVGPIGALGLMSSLVERTKLPCCVYRERYFADRGRISGSTLAGGDRVLLVYDLIVSGHGLRSVAENLRTHFDTTVNGAVVLFNFSGTQEIEGDHPFPTKSVAYYSDYEEAICQFRQDLQSGVESLNETIQVVEGDVAGTRRQSELRNQITFSPKRMGDEMNDDQSVVLIFGSIEEFESAVEAFYNKDELSGYEIDTFDGRSLIVPRSSLNSLTKLGVRFELAA